jgi:hypothetical protein
LTKETALAQLEAGQVEVSALFEASPHFRRIADDRGVVYELLHDYGMGAVLIADMRSGRLTWSMELRDN